MKFGTSCKLSEPEKVVFAYIIWGEAHFYCEAQGKGRAKGRPRKVTQRSFIDGGWWMVDGGYPFPDALH